jgi:hypothetical protein
MRAGFRDFAAEMHKTRLGIGESAKDLRLRGQGEFAEQLRHTKTNAEALELILNKLDQLHDPQHRRDFLKSRGLPPGLADANRKEREKLIKEWRDSVGATTKEDENAADQFEHSIWRMGNAFEALTQKLTTEGTLDTFTKSLNSIADLVPRIIKGINDLSTFWGTFQQFMGVSPAAPQKMSYSGGTFGGAQVMRASLTGGGDEKAKETIAEGVVEGLKKWALEEGAPEGPGAHGGTGGGSTFGGAPVIRASLGGGSRGGDGSGSASSPMGSKVAEAIGGASPDQAGRPSRIQGAVTVGGQTFGYASGGRGRGSVPFGDYPINFGDIGPVGRRIGSIAGLGGAGGTIDDPRYPGRPRAGIQIHPGSGATLDRLYTQGCFAVPRQQWPAFKRALLEQAKNGPLMLHIGRDGRAEVMTRQDYEARHARPPAPVAKPQSDAPRPPAVPREKMMDAAARSSQVARIEGAASVRIDLAGYGRAPNNSTPSAGTFSDVQLHRGNTIPYASESA